MNSVSHLLDIFSPRHYDLQLAFADSLKNYTGTVVITGDLKNESPVIRLHAKELVIQSATINQDPVEIEINDPADEVLLTCAKLIPEGEIVVVLTFSGEIQDPMHGIYPCYYKDNKNNQQRLIATQFESHHAREAFPCIDEPAAKATFDVKLVTPEVPSILGNTPIQNQSTTNGRTTTQFETTPVMSTYLLAFVFGDLVSKKATTKSGIETRIWATPINADHLDYALDVATQVLEFYEDYFNIPFPLSKVDHVALPDFAAGAMENWGLITYRESALLLEAQNSTIAGKQRIAIVIAHELAHQWFGNLVTMQWWTDLWLNEGFASWTEYLAIDHLYPDWQMWTQFVSDDMYTGMSLDALVSSHPIEVPIDSPADIRGIFDAISYSKGASVIRMLHSYLGAEDFRRGIQHYLQKYTFANATTADLWLALEDISQKPVAEFMSQWTSKTGFPVVRAEVNEQRVELSQQRYLVNPLARKQNQDSTIWPIPVELPQLAEGLFQTNAASVELSSQTDGPIIINKDQTGFFSVDYDQAHLEKLTAANVLPKLDDITRMGILNDRWLLAKAGYGKTILALQCTLTLDNEFNPSVWDTLSRHISVLRRAMGDETIAEALRPFMARLGRIPADNLSWTPRETDTHFDGLLRPMVLGAIAFGNDPDALAEIDQQFNNMTAAHDIEPNLRGIIFVTAARRGNNVTFERLLEYYLGTQSAQLKSPLIAGLTSFEQPELIQRSLDLITSDQVKPQEIHNWMASIFTNRHAKETAWDWLKTNWGWFEENFGTDIMTFSYMPKYAAMSMNTQNELDDYVEFFTQANTEGIDRQVEQGRETIEWQSQWRQRDYQNVVSFLKSL